VPEVDLIGAVDFLPEKSVEKEKWFNLASGNHYKNAGRFPLLRTEHQV